MLCKKLFEKSGNGIQMDSFILKKPTHQFKSKRFISVILVSPFKYNLKILQKGIAPLLNTGIRSKRCKMDGIQKGREIYNRLLTDKIKKPVSKDVLIGKSNQNFNQLNNTEESFRCSTEISFNVCLRCLQGLTTNLNSRTVFVSNKPITETVHSSRTFLNQLAAMKKIINKPQVSYYSTSKSTSPESKVEQDNLVPNLNEDDFKSHTAGSISPIEANLKQSEKHMLKFSASSKSILHNCFTIIANELKDRTLNLSPQYKVVKSKRENIQWSCVYNLKWPEHLSFSYVASSKKEASSKAALSALLWLYKNKKIDSRGMPVLYSSKEVKEVTKNIPTLTIDKQLEIKLKTINNIFEQKLLSAVNNYNSDLTSNQSLSQVEKEWPEPENYMKAPRNMNSYIVKSRAKLPISDYREKIIEHLKRNRILIIKGEPGCGKSTRVPQYILEEWAAKGDATTPCRIVVTQPRRIAAISLADRVANERNETVGSIVGYQVRLDSKFNKRTGRIMYCTAGLLLRHLQSDPKLSDCTHVILDEAHERDIYVDLLMNLLRKALELNDNLKIVIMSATIDTSLFQNYFKGAPLLTIPGFTFPVKEHFIEENAVAFEKTLKMCKNENPYVVYEDIIELIQNIHKKKPEGAILCFLPGWDEINKVKEILQHYSTMSVLCLHSRIAISEQKKVFSRPPPGIRKVILCTNIAETSVTVDDVVYVIDTGIHKEQTFDAEKGIYCIGNQWISQSNMAQRKGRAGRVQAGESYHLYPYSLYEKFPKFTIPEILRTSLTKIVLDSKVVSNNMDAEKFLSELPTPPDLNAIKRAVKELKELELLDEEENVTFLGRTLSEFQLDPKLSKAMVMSVIFKCVTPIVDIVTLFSSGSELFLKGLSDKRGTKDSKEAFSKSSDHLAYMRLFEQWLEYYEEGDRDRAKQFCNSYGVAEAKLNNIKKLWQIHYDYLEKGLHRVFPISDEFSDNDSLVLGVLLSGVGTLLQQRNWDFVKGHLKKTKCYLTIQNSQKATITSESINFKKTKPPSELFLYLNEILSHMRRTILIRETSLISPLTVLLFKNKDIVIEEIPSKLANEEKSEEKVLLKLHETTISFICNKEQALLIKKCKEALQTGIKYYVYQITVGNNHNAVVDEAWQNVLNNLNDILLTQNYDTK